MLAQTLANTKHHYKFKCIICKFKRKAVFFRKGNEFLAFIMVIILTAGSCVEIKPLKVEAVQASTVENSAVISASGNSWILGETKISDITMTTSEGKEVLGKRLDITVSNKANN